VLAAAVAALLLVDLLLLFTGAHRSFGEERREGADLRVSLLEGSHDLKKLQSDTNEMRSHVSQAFDSLDRTFNLARAPDGAGIEEAKASMEALGQSMARGRAAKTKLPVTTAKIIDLASKNRGDAIELASHLDSPKDKEYLRAWAEALQMLAATHRSYQAMNERIASGFVLYDEVYALQVTFFKEEASRSFRTKKEASQVFSHRSGNQAERIRVFRADLAGLEQKAEELGLRTRAAYVKAQTLRPR